MATKLAISKSGFNVLTETNPKNFIFSSDYGTLKYHTKTTLNVSFDADAGIVAGQATYTHNLGYYPYVEVLVRVYIGSPAGNYEYCPFFGSGVSVAYDATYKITSSTIVVYGAVGGFSTSVWNFDFILFVYRNDLGL